MKTTIYHNPRCSKSRQTLQLLRDKGVEPEIIEYLKTPPTVEQLAQILNDLEMQPRDLMRKKEAEYKEHNLADESLSDDELIAAMVAHPKLIERPIVIAENVIAGKDKTVLGRPPENVLDLVSD